MSERWYGRSVMRRLPRLMAGLVILGAAIAIMVRSDLGLSPWETLHQGISEQTGIPIGTVSILLSVPILVLWIPLGERPGIGTVINFLTVGAVTNLVLAVLPAAEGLPAQLAFSAAAIALQGLAVGLYISCALGPGPRDGLFTGLHRRFGIRIAATRGLLEATLLVAGFLLGGTIGIGTIAFVLAIGPLTELSLRWFDREGRVLRRAAPARLPGAPRRTLRHALRGR
jgi:uncharacterized membrane protein YczE